MCAGLSVLLCCLQRLAMEGFETDLVSFNQYQINTDTSSMILKPEKKELQKNPKPNDCLAK